MNLFFTCIQTGGLFLYYTFSPIKMNLTNEIKSVTNSTSRATVLNSNYDNNGTNPYQRPIERRQGACGVFEWVLVTIKFCWFCPYSFFTFVDVIAKIVFSTNFNITLKTCVHAGGLSSIFGSNLFDKFDEYLLI